MKKVTWFSLGLTLQFLLSSCVSLPKKEMNLAMSLLKKNEKLVLFGHKSPDLDSYASSYAYGELLRAHGFDASSYALGEPNLETNFVLKELKMKPLPILSSLPESAKAILVDHSEPKQTLEGLSSDRIAQIIDHHKVSFETRDALSVEIEPIGATATLIYKKFEASGLKPSRNSATLLLAAILSDTRILTSPTTTEVDRKACLELSSLTGRDYKKFGKAILTAGTKTDHLSAEKVYHLDRKTYSFGAEKASIGVVNTANIKDTLKRRREFLTYMKDFCQEGNFSFCALLVSNALEKKTFALVVGDSSLFDKAFADKKQDGGYFLDKVVSRKKQVVPALEKHL